MATVATIESLTVGGRVFTDLNNLIVLYGRAGSGGGGPNATFRLSSASSGYAVPASKVLTIMAYKIINLFSSTQVTGLNYADNDVGFISAAAFTSPVYYAGASNFDLGTPSSGSFLDGDLNFEVPASKYIGYSNNISTAGISFFIYGYLKDA